MRARQIERRDEDLNEALLRVCRHREARKETWDEEYHVLPIDHFIIGDLVLLHDTQIKKDILMKLRYR